MEILSSFDTSSISTLTICRHDILQVTNAVDFHYQRTFMQPVGKCVSKYLEGEDYDHIQYNGP
jgi:hypothetical protein